MEVHDTYIKLDKSIAQLITTLEIEVGQEVSLATGLRRLRRVCRPGTLAFVVSDFSDLDDITAQELRRLSNSAHVTNIQITDPLDAALPPQGGRLSDGDDAMALSAISRRELTSYADQFARRQQRLSDLSRQHAMAVHQLQTSDDPSRILHPHQSNRRAA
mgnify:CR=1 FL=1